MINERVLKNKIDQINHLICWWESLPLNPIINSDLYTLGMSAYREANRTLDLLEWIYKGKGILPLELSMARFEEYILECEAQLNDHNETSENA